jgi:1,4-alpha-glucan branching enzyme
MRTVLFFLFTLIIALIIGCASKPDYYKGRTRQDIVEDYHGPETARKGTVFAYKSERPAKKVYLTGSFNAWRPQDKEFELKQEHTGNWAILVPLEPGMYQYKFVVDGRWLSDPANTNTKPDGYGDSYSLVEVH